jgi:hypothetical protein
MSGIFVLHNCINTKTINMKRTLVLMALLPLLLMGVSCSKNSVPEALVLKSVSSETFTCNGGVGTIEVNRDDVQVESSEPQWLKVQVFESVVLFNVWSNSLPEDRSGKIILSAEGSAPVEVTITQGAFHGINVTPSSLTFSDALQEQSVAVVASGDFSVEFTENPSDIFSYEIVNSNLVKFSVSKAQGRENIAGRAVISLADGSESAVISLYLPKKSVYDYLLGTWEVTANTSSSRYPMTFKVKESQSSYYVYLDAPGIKDYPFVAEFINGNVKINTGQEMGNDGVTYYNMHFNGPINGQGTYIFNSPGKVAMEAVPVFDEATGRISLSFTDNGQGMGSVARDMVFWCGKKYWSFESNVAGYTNFTLQKSYVE